MRSLLIVSGLAVCLNACGGSEDKPRGQIHFASILSKTGVNSSSYQLGAGAVALAAKTINDAGGILGNDVVFDEYDEAAGTNGVQPITDISNQLVDAGTQVWIGPGSSDDAFVAGPVAGANERLMIAPIVGSKQYSTIDDHDYAFRGVQSPWVTATAGATAAYAAGHHTAAVLHLNIASGIDYGHEFADTFTAKGGTITTIHPYIYNPASPQSFDPQTELAAVFAGNPDVIFLYGTIADSVALLTAWNTADWHGQWIFGVLLGSPELAAAVGPSKVAGSLLYSAVPIDPADVASLGGAFQDLNGFTVPGPNLSQVAAVLDSCFMAALSIEQAGEATGTKARDQLRLVANAPGTQVKGSVDYASALDIVRSGGDLDYIGLSSAIEYDANGDFPSNVGEYVFNSSGGIDFLRVRVTGVDF